MTALVVEIYFAYGLMLFLMGFAAALGANTYRQSHLPLARNLFLLAAFGMLIGAAEWGVVFIPMQADYLGMRGIAALYSLHGLVLLIGHACLLLFGIRLLREWEPVGLRTAGAVAGGAIACTLAGVAGWGAGEGGWVYLIASYGFGLPGAILGARGLILQSRAVRPFHPRPARWLLVAGWAFVISLPLGPLAVPVQVGTPVYLFGVPVQVPLMIGAVLLAISLLAGLEVLRVEHARRLERAERREAVLEERYRLGKELNDGVIQDLFAAGLLMGVAGVGLPAPERERLAQVERHLQSTVDRLRVYIKDLAPLDWTQPDLLVGLGQLLDDFRANTLLPVTVDVEPGLELFAVRVQEVYPILHEALSNVRRHADATMASVSLRRWGTDLEITLVDNGRGIATGAVRGTGWERMHQGAAALGGRLAVGPAPGGGTKIILRIPELPLA